MGGFMSNCIFCGNEIADNNNEGIIDIECGTCGYYRIDVDEFKDFQNTIGNKIEDKKHLISGYLYEMKEIGYKPDIIKLNNINRLYSNSFVPGNPAEKIEKLILYLYRRTKTFGQYISIRSHQTSVCYAVDSAELNAIIRALSNRRDIDIHSATSNCRLTEQGILRAINIEKTSNKSRQVFVAMWFSEEMNKIYSEYIVKAICESKEKNYFKPMRIDKSEHINKICDEIIAEIRKSKFIVADLTGQRAGVYFEAGFAYGLNLPVIYTCREDWFDGIVEQAVDVYDAVNNVCAKQKLRLKQSVHFDIRQYNCIVWKDGTDLYKQLKNRIEAIIL
jgi:nucleoside 2-deoxyribosyltransferase